jgi:hypothetical protein
MKANKRATWLAGGASKTFTLLVSARKVQIVFHAADMRENPYGVVALPEYQELRCGSTTN